MKKIFSFLSFSLFLALSASAFTSGKFNYTIVGDNEVEICRPADISEDGGYKDVVDLPSSVSYGGKTYTVVGIGERAFQHAEIASMLILPSTYRYIGPWAFHSAYGVAVMLSENTDSLGVGAFAYNELNNLLCNENNPKYSLIYSRDLPEGETWVGGVLVTKDKETVVAFPGGKKVNGSYVYTYNVPSIVKHIAPHAFHGAPHLKRVVFHDAVEDIGEYACYECLEMTRVEIPGNTKLSYAAFAACETNLNTIILHEGVREIPDYCFFDAENCTSLQLPSTLERIGEYALCYFENITTITLPENLQILDTGALSSCTRLSTVNFNDNCRYVGPQCFASCDALVNIDLNKVQIVDKLAFNGCSNLTNVTLDHVTHLGRAPFYQCSKITKIDLPETLVYMDPVTFMMCRALNELTIPASVQYIGGGTAAGATSLKEIAVAEGSDYFTTIDGVLYDKALTTLVAIPGGWEPTELNLPATVTTVAEQAGHWCNITKLNAPGVKLLNKSAFSECASLEEVLLGAKCDSIGETVFAACSAITKVTSLNQVPPKGGIFEDAVYTAATLYVPVGYKAAYQADENWQKFVNIEEIEVETPSLEPGDLNGDGNVDVSDVSLLIDVVLGKDVTLAEGAVVDLNGDGNTDVSDVSLLIDMILGKN